MKNSQGVILTILLVIAIGFVSIGVLLLQTQSATSEDYPSITPNIIVPSQQQTISPQTTPTKTITDIVYIGLHPYGWTDRVRRV